MNRASLVAYLRDLVISAGSQKILAIEMGVSEQYLGDVLAGRREPGKKILDAIGFVKVTTYVEK